MSLRFNTKAIHSGNTIDDTGAIAIPIYRTSAYVFKNAEHASNLFALKELGNIYTRLQNPTQDALEKRVADLEGGVAALALSSGTSAIFYTVINTCASGDEVVASANLYGGTFTMFKEILPKMGISVKFVNPVHPREFEAAISEKTRLLFTEVIGNPSLDVANIKEIAAIGDKHHIPLAVDSTFTPPSIFRPIEHGAHIVIHSLSKWIGGQGTAIGGIVVDSGKFDWSDPKYTLYYEADSSYHNLRFGHDLGDLQTLAFILRMRLIPLRNLGACISPDNAWLFLQGLETLALRMERHSENALKVAQFLKTNKNVAWVRYPGLEDDPGYRTASEQLKNGYGGIVVFGVKGGRAAGEQFINKLDIFSHLANVGDAKSLAIHPASTTHSQLSEEDLEKGSISSDLIRLSIGIEDIADILEDLEQALN
jgi:O-acetylhomoserine (thiol)-lyase